MGERKKMKFKSKSQILRELFTKLDNSLSKIPDVDYKGHPLVESDEMSKYLTDLKNIFCSDRDGNMHKPLGIDFCTKLIYDEIDSRAEVQE